VCVCVLLSRFNIGTVLGPGLRWGLLFYLPLRERAEDVQRFSHSIFVLPPHFLRHCAVYLLHVPLMGEN
jgi:hypothetical protein